MDEIEILTRKMKLIEHGRDLKIQELKEKIFIVREESEVKLQNLRIELMKLKWN